MRQEARSPSRQAKRDGKARRPTRPTPSPTLDTPVTGRLERRRPAPRRHAARGTGGDDSGPAAPTRANGGHRRRRRRTTPSAHAAAHADARRRPRRRHRRPLRRRTPAAPAAPEAGGVSAPPRLSRREQARRPRPRHARLPAAQNRQGRSTALRDPDARAGDDPRLGPAGARGSMPDGPVHERRAVSSSPIPSACVSLPGPEHSSSTPAAPAPRRASARCPSSGSSARISTAAPDARPARRPRSAARGCRRSGRRRRSPGGAEQRLACAA